MFCLMASKCLSYGKKIIDQKEVDADDVYIEAIVNYIGTNIFIPGRDYLPILVKVNIGNVTMRSI